MNVLGVVFVVSLVMLWVNVKEGESMLEWCPAARLLGSLLDVTDGGRGCCLFLEMEAAHLTERSGKLGRAEQGCVAAFERVGSQSETQSHGTDWKGP